MDKPLYKQIVEIILDVKGFGVSIYDMRPISAEMDYIILCVASSTAHITGISQNIQKKLKQKKILPFGLEGYKVSDWLLMDYNEVVVNIMTDEKNEYYDLEKFYVGYLKAKKVKF